jgi:hypothetical protein
MVSHIRFFCSTMTQSIVVAASVFLALAVAGLITGSIGTGFAMRQIKRNVDISTNFSSLSALTAILTGPFTNGQLLIGDSVTEQLVVNTLTAGAGIAVTNGPGTVAVALRSPVQVNFTTSFSQAIPAGATYVLVTAVGGGGSGGAGKLLAGPGGGGGGGGAVIKDFMVRLTNVVASITGNIGAGGASSSGFGSGGANGDPSDVTVGYLYLRAFGGGGGVAGDGPNDGDGGGGGGSNSAGAGNVPGSYYTGSNTPNAGLSQSGGIGAVRDSSTPADALPGLFFIAGAGGGSGSTSTPTDGGAFPGGGAGGAAGAAGAKRGGGGAAGYNGDGGAGGDTGTSGLGLPGIGRGSGGGGSSGAANLSGAGGDGMVTLTFYFQ